MKNVKLEFILNITKFYTTIAKLLDWRLAGWLGFNDFIILYYLSNALENKLRISDIAEKLWYTPSWVARMLLPMEKIWLISRMKDNQDSRNTFIIISKAWWEKLSEAIENLNYILDENISDKKKDNLKDCIELIQEIWWKFLWN